MAGSDEKEALRAARAAKPEKTAPPASEGGLVSLKRSRAEIKKNSPMAINEEREQYPWGTRLSLQKEDLAKLGIKSLPKPGSTMKLTADVEVVSVSQSAGHDKQESKEMALQITAMKLSGGEE